MNSNDSQEENSSIIINNKDENIDFKIIYKINPKGTQIFSARFINENKDKCKIIYKNKEYELKEHFEEIDNDYKNKEENKEEISFILRINKNITDISHMFYECDTLLSISDISNINTFNNIDTSNLNNIYDKDELYNEDSQNKENNFYKDFDQMSPAISTITNNYTSNYFLTNIINNEDNLLSSLDCYNLNNILNMSHMFYGCSSLVSLPDISKWNTSKVTNMTNIFYGCESLISLPDISKWNISKITNMNNMFYGCSALVSLPDLSKWNISNVTKMSYIFYRCESLKSLPDISKWNTFNVTEMYDMF